MNVTCRLALCGIVVMTAVVMPSVATARTAPFPRITCPTSLPFGSTAPESVLKVVRQDVKRVYTPSERQGYEISLLVSLRPGSYQTLGSSGRLLRQIAIHQCGVTVANRSWLVLMEFPRLAPSNDMYGAQWFVARTPSGWQVWFRFH
ncbi:MAG TPA: hypothetical protein VFB58_13695 [Chloroflexota bacterium]|nr:hypothetical protein [Chloroflexota bacterium]